MHKIYLNINMKLFITNREEFSDNFPETPKSKYIKKGSEIHKNAFGELSKQVANNRIPIVLITDYDDDGLVLFDFIKRIDEIYFYEYTGTAK